MWRHPSVRFEGLGFNAPDFSPDGPDMWPGRPGHVARTGRTGGPDGPDMWPGQPGHVGGPDGPDPGQPGHVARTSRTRHQSWLVQELICSLGGGGGLDSSWIANV